MSRKYDVIWAGVTENDLTESICHKSFTPSVNIFFHEEHLSHKKSRAINSFLQRSDCCKRAVGERTPRLYIVNNSSAISMGVLSPTFIASHRALTVERIFSAKNFAAAIFPL